MTYDDTSPNPIATSIEATIAQHGALRVFSAAFLALVHPPHLRPPPSTEAQDLDDHLRRDVGLPPKRAAGPAPPLHLFQP